MQVRLSGAKWFSCWVVQLLLVVRAYKNIATYHIWLQHCQLLFAALRFVSVWYKNINFRTKNYVFALSVCILILFNFIQVFIWVLFHTIFVL